MLPFIPRVPPPEYTDGVPKYCDVSVRAGTQGMIKAGENQYPSGYCLLETEADIPATSFTQCYPICLMPDFQSD